MNKKITKIKTKISNQILLLRDFKGKNGKIGNYDFRQL